MRVKHTCSCTLQRSPHALGICASPKKTSALCVDALLSCHKACAPSLKGRRLLFDAFSIQSYTTVCAMPRSKSRSSHDASSKGTQRRTQWATNSGGPWKLRRPGSSSGMLKCGQRNWPVVCRATPADAPEARFAPTTVTAVAITRNEKVDNGRLWDGKCLLLIGAQPAYPCRPTASALRQQHDLCRDLHLALALALSQFSAPTPCGCAMSQHHDGRALSLYCA